MKSIIKKSLEALSIEAIVSRRTYNLLDRIEFLEKEIYPKEKGYVRGVLAPTFSSKVENPPQPLPEAVRGDALTCLLYTSPSPRDISGSRMPSSA